MQLQEKKKQLLHLKGVLGDFVSNTGRIPYNIILWPNKFSNTYIVILPVMVPVAIRSREGWASNENKGSSNASSLESEESPLLDDAVKLMQWGGMQVGSLTSEIPAMFSPWVVCVCVCVRVCEHLLVVT